MVKCSKMMEMKQKMMINSLAMKKLEISDISIAVLWI